VCHYKQFPGVLWASSSDQTGLFPGLECKRLEHGDVGSSATSWATWQKIARLIEGLPFE
jgi:hypothetical protein